MKSIRCLMFTLFCAMAITKELEIKEFSIGSSSNDSEPVVLAIANLPLSSEIKKVERGPITYYVQQYFNTSLQKPIERRFYENEELEKYWVTDKEMPEGLEIFKEKYTKDAKTAFRVMEMKFYSQELEKSTEQLERFKMEEGLKKLKISNGNSNKNEN